MRSEDHSERCQCSVAPIGSRLRRYKSKHTSAVATVSKEKLRVRVAYRIALVMYGLEGAQRRNTSPPIPSRRCTPIPLCNGLAESIHLSGGNTTSDICASDVKISQEHPSFHLVIGVTV